MVRVCGDCKYFQFNELQDKTGRIKGYCEIFREDTVSTDCFAEKCGYFELKWAKREG
jgi:hypothetical protein